MRQNRYLIVKLAAIGDVIVASTIVQRLRAEQPNCHITWLCGATAAPVVRLLEVDDVIVVEEKDLLTGSLSGKITALLGVWRRLLGRRIDVALVVHPDRRYRLLVAPLWSARRVYLTRARYGRMNPIPARFLGDEYARLLDFGRNAGPIERRYEVADLRRRLVPTSAGRPVAEKCVALAPGGARNVMRDDPLRRWPVESYALVADALLREGCTVAIVGGPSDDWVRNAFAGLGVRDLVGHLSIPETLAFLATCDAVVTHDTGPLHMARAVRAPTVALFGPTIPAQVIGPSGMTHVLWGGEHLACRPCHDGRDFADCHDNQCIKSITVAEVLAAVRDLLVAAPAAVTPETSLTVRSS